jgi:uncharacterized protein (DUF1330 family)
MTEATPVYMIVQLVIEDFDRLMNEYAPAVRLINERHGARVIVGTSAVDVIEGEYDRNLTVIIEFPSASAQQAWYEDPDYAPLKAMRLDISDTKNSSIIVAPAFSAPS